MDGEALSGVMIEAPNGTVMFERRPDGRRHVWMLKDDSYRERIDAADVLGVVYTRFSSHNQNECSTEVQLRADLCYCAEQGIGVAEVYSDEGRTGTNDRRIEFHSMITGICGGKVPGVPKGRKVERVIVHKQDRFSRGEYDPSYYKYLLKKRGARVVSATEPRPEGAVGVLVEKNLEAAAAYFSLQQGERIKAHLAEHAEECWTNGMYVAGYVRGKNKKFRRDRRLSGRMRDAIEQMAEGIPVESVERGLEGVADARGRGFDAARLRKMAHDRRYAGEYRYGTVVVPGGMPALVSIETLERAAANVDRQAAEDASKARAEHLRARVRKPDPPSKEKLERLRYRQNIKGRRFGWLKAIEVARIDKNHHHIWLCKCRCGNLVEVYATRLKSGLATDCGCASGDGRRRDKHGRYAMAGYAEHIAAIKADMESGLVRAYVENDVLTVVDSSGRHERFLTAQFRWTDYQRTRNNGRWEASLKTFHSGDRQRTLDIFGISI